jgi:protein dithiol oxidoreductase (disulfide-forming)
MKKLISNLLVVASALWAGFAGAEGVAQYGMLASPQPSSKQKIEVLEFFFYECSHCFHLHPLIASWEKNKARDVDIAYVPTIFRDTTEPLARTYFALEGMGQIKQVDDAIFQAIHVKQVGLFDLDSIGTFMAKNGVDKQKFSDAYNSFTVQSKVTRAKQMIRSYNIQGTPTLIVDGRFIITGLQPTDTIRVLDQVINQVRKERAPAGKKH